MHKVVINYHYGMTIVDFSNSLAISTIYFLGFFSSNNSLNVQVCQIDMVARVSDVNVKS